MVELLVRADRERRRALVVERTARRPVAAGLFQRHALLDHVDNVDARQQIVNELFRDASSHPITHISGPHTALCGLLRCSHTTAYAPLLAARKPCLRTRSVGSQCSFLGITGVVS